MNKSIVLISDIHGNANALEVVLKEISTIEKVDQIIILGDLLTYGCRPNKVVELLEELNNEYECIFIKGNHEEFYFNIQSSKEPFTYEPPAFVKEAILWTGNNLKKDLNCSFKWVESLTVDECYFAHANPFGYGDWTYLNDKDSHTRAALKLEELNCKYSFFGHTHRNKAGIYTDKKFTFFENTEKVFSLDKSDEESRYIFNTGSIGQARGTKPSYIKLLINEKNIQVIIRELDLDHTNTISEIEESSLSDETKKRLISYLRSS
ncbi:MAG: hypothetical protein BM556_08935 [Bacteriovorax sp. MedPE-SWde]|nr:MAG: hypothetical protein BM556_08935 [Bacteriovorax sp. MedPE-SWde]